MSSNDAIVMGVSGALAGSMTEIIFYGLDSYKIAKQAGARVIPSTLFRGAIPIALLGSGPSFGVFFAFYSPLTTYFKSHLFAGRNEEVAVLLSATLSAVPSSLVAVPADTLKKQVILGTDAVDSHQKDQIRGLKQALRRIVGNGRGIGGLFVGWQANLLRDIPFAVVKMSLFEGVAKLYLAVCSRSLSDGATKQKAGDLLATIPDKDVPSSSRALARLDESSNVAASAKLTELESATVGLLSGVCTAVLTSPVDCVNTRIKSGELAGLSVFRAHAEVVRRDGLAALFRGLGPRAAILGLGSTVFWYSQATLKHIMIPHLV